MSSFKIVLINEVWIISCPYMIFFSFFRKREKCTGTKQFQKVIFKLFYVAKQIKFSNMNCGV